MFSEAENFSRNLYFLLLTETYGNGTKVLVVKRKKKFLMKYANSANGLCLALVLYRHLYSA